MLRTIIIFERHWDTRPKQLITNVLPQLKASGYNLLCLEAPHDLSPAVLHDRVIKSAEDSTQVHEKVISLLKKRHVMVNGALSDMGYQALKSLVYQYISTRNTTDVVELLLNYPAQLAMKTMMEQAQILAMPVMGIDIDSARMEKLLAINLESRITALDIVAAERNQSMVGHLQTLQRENKGVVFLCGVDHAEEVMVLVRQYNLQDYVSCYFVHSERRFDDSIDDIAIYSNTDTLREKSILLTNDGEVKDFSDKLLKEMRQANQHCLPERVNKPKSLAGRLFKSLQERLMPTNTMEVPSSSENKVKSKI